MENQTHTKLLINLSENIGVSYFEKPILVTGAARSGTSMVAGLLAQMGAWTGPTTPGSFHNINGFFENRDIKVVSTYRLLKEAGFDRIGQRPIPPVNVAIMPTFDLREEVARIIRSQGYVGKRQWLFKDAKLLLCQEAWIRAFPKATWVICKRKDEETLRSITRTRFMQANLRNEAERQEWLDIHKERIYKLLYSGAQCYVLDTDKIAKRDLSDFSFVCSELGLNFDEPAIRSFIVPEVWARP